MIEKYISEALQTAALTACAVADNTLAIQPLGVSIVPDNTQKYFEFVQIRNNNNGRYWSNQRVYQGILRIILHWPIDDKGDYPVLTLMDALAGQFSKGQSMSSGSATVKIYEEPDLGASIPNDYERLFPLSLSYRCFSVE